MPLVDYGDTSAESLEGSRNLLLLLLVNEGLVRAVRLAPPELWRAALRQVYGNP